MKVLNIEERDNHILLVTFDRPEVRNAINTAMISELRDLWQRIYQHPKSLRCIILTGNGKAFCAGADLKERDRMNMAELKAQRAVFEQAMLAMVDCPIPIIAAVNGSAFGGGLELLLASDFAYATTDATFSQSEVRVGLMPGAMGTQNLPRACGIKRAKELTFTGDVFSAQEAFEWGIVNKLSSPENLLNDVLATAKKIAENAPLAVRQAKKALNVSQHLDIKSGFAFELEAYNRVLASKDREEGIRAFNEKRKPVFMDE